MLSSLSPARRRLWLVVAAAVAVGMAALVVAVLAGRDPAVVPVPQDAQPPVLLVPGYGGSTAALQVMAEALRATGRDARVVELAGDGVGDLAQQAEVLQAAVQALGADSVDLVGYSAGGLTVRLWLREHGGGSVARRVLTLASPHHGTRVAALALDLTPDSCPEACRQLATDSDLIRSLNAGDETPPGPRWVALWTDDDDVVTPPSSGSLDGALDLRVQSVCPGRRVEHGDVPRDPVVIAMALAVLGTAPPVAPGAEVCAAPPTR